MSKQRIFQLREFKCPVCNQIWFASKRKKYKTNNGHIKTMYCFMCKQERNFIQIDDKQFVK